MMREMQQKPSWKQPSGGGDGGGGGGGSPAQLPCSAEPAEAAAAAAGGARDADALRTVQTYIMLEQRRRADFSIDAILKFDH